MLAGNWVDEIFNKLITVDTCKARVSVLSKAKPNQCCLLNCCLFKRESDRSWVISPSFPCFLSSSLGTTLVHPAPSYSKPNYFLCLWPAFSNYFPTISSVQFPPGVQLQNQALLEIFTQYWLSLRNLPMKNSSNNFRPLILLLSLSESKALYRKIPTWNVNPWTFIL